MTAGLEHKAVEATTRVDSDLGEFAAIAATYDVDRVKDRIRFGAFEKTIAAWQASGKRVPLHWEHRGEARNVIGSADPARMREVAGLGLYVEEKLDLDDSAVAREAWRSMKDNRVGLLFGYMTVKSQCRDGINHLLELDLYEISITPGPIKAPDADPRDEVGRHRRARAGRPTPPQRPAGARGSPGLAAPA
jgi:HK97 family phage prohead protease